jgi:PAS domain S-box-containing protein
MPERKRAPAKLSDDAKSLADRFAFLDAAPDAMVLVDSAGLIVLANAEAERLLGYPVGELLGQPVELLVPLNLRGAHPAHRAEFFSDPRTRTMGSGLELSARRKDGTEFPVEISLSPVSVDGRHLAIAAIRDVTIRRRTDGKFRALLEAAPDAMVIVNADGRISLVNSQTERLFGYARAELVGHAIEMLVPNRFRDGHPQHRNGYFADPHPRPMGGGLSLWGRRKDGSEFPVEISLSPVETEDGTLVTAAVRDISERLRHEEMRRELAQQKLEQEALTRHAADLARSNAELEQFAYVASHDLQEPLRMVASYTQLLAKRYRGKLDSDADDFIGHAVDGVNRMQQLITDLLSYSRVGSQGKSFERTECEPIVAAVISNLEPSIVSLQAVITHDTLPAVLGDDSQLAQLFQNLLGNALKFRGPDAPHIHVAVEPEDREWHFRVRDNGIGIAPEYADRIFAMFQRLHTSAEYPGTGIGLAICKKIVERHGGRIWLESHPDREPGTTFHFTLIAAPSRPVTPISHAD